MLIPTITIVCRIDTLEKPLLQPRCVGFAVLKLCVDANGVQPSPGSNSKHVYLNAGQYLLPIVYGSVPSSGVFSESLMDKLPHIYDAYLSVRLFDPNAESSNSLSKGIDLSSLTTGRDARHYNLENTIIGTLIKCQSGAVSSLPRLPVDDFLVQEIKKGVEVNAEEKKLIVRQVNEWLIRLFPPVHQKLPGVNTRYLLNYDHRIGAFVALDMLYNMPDSKKFMKSTAEALSRMQATSVFNKPWDDKTSCFKTYFRYLPGSSIPKKLKGDATDFVIDDASMELDFTSKEYNPVYMDDFSRTTGFELSHNACLLVVVTAVDVVTSKKADSLNPTQYFRNNTAATAVMMSPPKPRPVSRGEVMSFTFEAEDNKKAEMRTLQERAFKLRGLVGLYYGHDDPEATWWGIVPLITRNQSARTKKSKSHSATLNVISNNNNNSTTPNTEPVKVAKFGKESVIPTQRLYSAPDASEESSNIKINNWTGGAPAPAAEEPRETFEIPRTPVNIINNNVQMGSIHNYSPSSTPSQTPANGMRGAYMDGTGSASGSASGSRGGSGEDSFVNSGTHQVPLFHGLPPEDMTRSSNPLAWVLSNLTAQERTKYLKSTCFGGGNKVLQNYPPPAVDLHLSPGASAMVSIVDPRLRQFCHDSIAQDPQVPIVQDTLLKILRISVSKFDRKSGALLPPSDAQYRSVYSKFEYNQFRSFSRRTMEAAIPHNILHDALLMEINEKFTEKMSE